MKITPPATALIAVAMFFAYVVGTQYVAFRHEMRIVETNACTEEAQRFARVADAYTLAENREPRSGADLRAWMRANGYADSNGPSVKVAPTADGTKVFLRCSSGATAVAMGQTAAQ